MSRIKKIITTEKIHAFLIHLSLSLLIFSVILYFILVDWYPQPLFSTDGGWQGVRIILFVDIVLGPCLTFVVYKKGKPQLKLDLFIIGAIQFGALFSGIIVVYNEHPVAIILMNNGLHPITAYQVKEAEIKISSLKNYSEFHPPLIYSNLPVDQEQYQKLLKDSLKENRGLRLYGVFYEKITELVKIKLIKNSMMINGFVKGKVKEQKILDGFLQNTKHNIHNLIYFPIYSRYEHGVAVLDKNTFEIIYVLNIFPPAIGENFQTLTN